MSELTAVVFDLDGVIRHFDPARLVEIETRYGLEPGALWSTAFAPELVTQLVTGAITRYEWGLRVGQAVGNLAAAAEWHADDGTVDPEVLTLVDELRAEDLTVAILTNGTDTIPAELDRLGITDRFDRIFNTAQIGVAKPDQAIFAHVCAELATEPSTVFFTDDSQGHVDGAASAGLVAAHFVDAATTRRQLTDLGVAIGR
ncbi:MAG: HAD-IA family hydrolase [Actinomycetota bacterium]